jgi:hypothetical protein
MIIRTQSNKRLERTRRERASLLSCVGEPLKRRVGLLPFTTTMMLKICSSKQNDIEIFGSSQTLNAVAKELFQFLESDSEALEFEASTSFDPSPYDSVVKKLSVIKGKKPAKVSLIDGEEMRVEGSPESLRAFASYFEFEPETTVGDHSHFEYEGL